MLNKKVAKSKMSLNQIKKVTAPNQPLMVGGSRYH